MPLPNEDMVVIREVTFKKAKGLRFTRGTQVLLVAKLDRDEIDVHLSLHREGYHSLTMLVPGKLTMSDIPDPANNKRQWEKFRRLKRDDTFTLSQAYLKVAMERPTLKWKFSLERPLTPGDPPGHWLVITWKDESRHIVDTRHGHYRRIFDFIKPQLGVDTEW